MVNALAGRPIRPLWHLSGNESRGYTRGTELPLPTSRVGRGFVILSSGTVAEWTIAVALKAADPQGFVGSNPTRSAESNNVGRRQALTTSTRLSWEWGRWLRSFHVVTMATSLLGAALGSLNSIRHQGKTTDAD